MAHFGGPFFIPRKDTVIFDQKLEGNFAKFQCYLWLEVIYRNQKTINIMSAQDACLTFKVAE